MGESIALVMKESNRQRDIGVCNFFYRIGVGDIGLRTRGNPAAYLRAMPIPTVGEIVESTY